MAFTTIYSLRAGGINALQSQTVQIPQLTAETLLEIEPEIIIEIVPRLEKRNWSKNQVKETWQDLGAVVPRN